MKTIKLRDATDEQFRSYWKSKCITGKIFCCECSLNVAICDVDSPYYWINNKEKFSDDFLNQEIELEEE